MEVIKKKICLEDFICRVPGMIKTITSDIEKIQKNPNGSFGEIPYNVKIENTVIPYRTVMALYYDMLKIVMNAKYYEYDASANETHWIKIDYDWRDIFKNKINFYSEFPTKITDRTVIGFITSKECYTLYDNMYEVFDSTFNGINLIEKVNIINGRIIVPYGNKCKTCGTIHYSLNPQKCTGKDESGKDCTGTEFERIQEIFVPYFLYYKDVDKFIELLENLKSDKCCERRKYENYGGDAFYSYLKSIKEQGWGVYDSEEMPTIDIPLLLTSKLYDIGLYRAYDVDIIDENEDNNVTNNTDKKPTIINTKGESKLQTLRKRKQTLDDNNNQLPFIINKIVKEGSNDVEYKVELPYEVRYVKNITLNNDGTLYGDTIYSMIEKCTSKEITTLQYDAMEIPEHLQINGTLDSPVSGITPEQIKKNITSFDDVTKTEEEVTAQVSNDVIKLTYGIANKLKDYLVDRKVGYPNILGLSQEYNFTYKVKYSVEVELETPDYNENGFIIDTKFEEREKEIEHKGKVCVVYDDAEIEVIYVLGGHFKKVNTKDGIVLECIDFSPFDLASDKEWNGEGIWYRETFPMKKSCKAQIMYNGEEHTFFYDAIDFESKETVYEFDNIDFVRKKYILCNEIKYNSSNYNNDSTNDFIFKDEKMSGLIFPLKETYDVLVERGASVAFEKHLQLCDIKTWQDLENYRNGMFLNK